MPSSNLADIAGFIRQEQEKDERLLASLARPQRPKAHTYTPEERFGFISQRGKELIRDNPDRDSKLLQAGIDEIGEWKEAPNNYPVLEDLERYGAERMKRVEEASPGALTEAAKGVGRAALRWNEAANTGLQWLGKQAESGWLERKLGVADAGGKIAEWAEGNVEFLQRKQKEWGLEQAEKFKGKNAIDNPEILKDASWWAGTLAEFGTDLGAMILPSMQAHKIITTAGKATKMAPALIKSLADIGAKMTGGAIGVGLEATATYQNVLKQTGSHEEATLAAGLFAPAVFALNAFSVGKLMQHAGQGLMAKGGKALVNFLTEGTTEALEEPAEVASQLAAKIIQGKPVPEEWKEMFSDSMKQAATVFLPAGIAGGGMSMATGVGREAEKPVDDGQGMGADTGQVDEVGEAESSIQHPESSIQHPVSSIQHPESSIQHPESSIQHPESSIQNPVGDAQTEIKEIGAEGIALETLLETPIEERLDLPASARRSQAGVPRGTEEQREGEAVLPDIVPPETSPPPAAVIPPTPPDQGATPGPEVPPLTEEERAELWEMALSDEFVPEDLRTVDLEQMAGALEVELPEGYGRFELLKGVNDKIGAEKKESGQEAVVSGQEAVVSGQESVVSGQKEAAEPAVIRTKTDKPFKTEKSAAAGLKKAKKSEFDYDLIKEGDGYIWQEKAEKPTGDARLILEEEKATAHRRELLRDAPDFQTAVKHAGGLRTTRMSYKGEIRDITKGPGGVSISILNNKTGLGTDEMTLAMIEAGWLPQDATEDDLIEYIENNPTEKLSDYESEEHLDKLQEDEYIRQKDREREAGESEDDIDAAERDGEREADQELEEAYAEAERKAKNGEYDQDAIDELDIWFKEQQSLFGKPEEPLLKPEELTKKERLARAQDEAKKKGLTKKGKKPVFPADKGIKPANVGRQRGLFENEQGQIDLFDEGVEVPQNEQPIYENTEPEEIALVPGKEEGRALPGAGRVQYRTSGNIKAAGNVVTNTADLATLLARIRTEPDEYFLSVAVDENGTILEIHEHSKGGRSAGTVFSDIVVGRALQVPGVAKVYFAHNHPSYNPATSSPDVAITKDINRLLKIAKIPTESIIITGKKYLDFTPTDTGTPKRIKPALRKTLLKKVRRRTGRAYAPQVPGLTSSAQVIPFFNQSLNNEDGILLLTGQNVPVAFLPFVKGRSMQQTTLDILKLAEKINASTLIIKNDSDSTARKQYVQGLVEENLGSLNLLDVLEKGKSYADGELAQYRAGRLGEDARDARLGSDVRLSIASTKTPKGLSGPVVKDLSESLSKVFKGLRAHEIVTLGSEAELSADVAERAKAGREEPSGFLTRGLYDTDPATGKRTIYLFTDAMDSKQDVVDVFVHEAFHDGVASGLGDRAKAVLTKIYEENKGAVGVVAEARGLDLETEKGRAEAAEEWVVEGMVNDTLPKTVWDRIIRAVKAMLRKAGINVRYGYREIGLGTKYREGDIRGVIREAVVGREEQRGKRQTPITIDERRGKRQTPITNEKKKGIRKEGKPKPASVAGLTGDRDAKRSALRRFWGHFKEFWKPFSTVPEGDEALFARYEGMGAAARALRYIDKIHEKLDAFPDEVKKDLFRFMDGQIDENLLPEEARSLAVALKEKTTVIGQMLVDRGIISQESFDKMKGHYVHYMYAYHILGDKVGAVTTSTGKLNLSYAKQRKDLTADQKKALGLIEDASIAIPVGMGKALTDIAKFDYLEKIAANDKWVWTPSMVEVPRWPGRKGQKTTVKMGIGKLIEEVDKYKEMMEKSPSEEIKKKRDYLQAALDKAIEDTKNVPGDYTQLPTTKSYGPLAGAFVQTPIAKDVMPVVAFYSDKGKVWETLGRIETEGMALFKMGKVALNFPTAFRNVISNIMQNNMRGRPLLSVMFKDIPAALKSATAKDEYYEEAFSHGIFNTSWAQTEINDVLDEVRKAQAAGGGYHNALMLIKRLARWYGKIDDFSKHAIFLQMRKAGHTVDESVLEAMKWGMDYSLASRSVKSARKHYIPFASYQYKIAPLIAESLKKRPWVILKFMAVPFAMEALTRSMFDLDDDDWDDLEKQLPAYIKKSASMMILPRKTPEGQWQWVNAEYFFPWGNWLNLGRDVSDRDAGEIFKGLGISNPYLDVAWMIKSAVRDQPPQHPFYGTPLYNKLDPAPMKAAKVVQFLAFTWMPSMLSPDKGALGYSIKAVEGKKDKWDKKVTPGQAFARWFGFNIVAVSPSQTRAIAAVNVQDLRKELYRIKNDPQKSDEQKAAAEQRYRERLAEIAETGASGAILPIVKKKGKDPVYETLIRMLKQGASLPGPAGRTFSWGGVKHKMGNDQYENYLERTSNMARPRLERLMSASGWANRREEWKERMIKRIVAGARKRARSEMKRRMGRTSRSQKSEVGSQ